MRVGALFVAVALLAGCGESPDSRTTNDPVALNVIEASAEGTPAAVAAATDCSNRPGFVAVYPGAQITLCLSGPDGLPGHVSGNIVYLTPASVREVLDWSRAQANAAGLVERTLTPTGFTAGEKERRSMTVRIDPVGSETRVTIAWGGEV